MKIAVISNLNYKKMENDEIKYIKCYCVSVGKPILNDAILLTGICKALSYDDIKKAVFWEIQILFSEN